MLFIKPQVELEINPQLVAVQNVYGQNPTMPTQSISSVWVPIQAALDRLDKTQEWLAEQIGVSNNAVTKWKQSGGIGRENAKKVSALLGVSLDGLLAGKYHPVVEALEELPIDQSTTIMRQIMYQIEHADGVLGGDRSAHYLKTMAAFIKDLEKRKKRASK